MIYFKIKDLGNKMYRVEEMYGRKKPEDTEYVYIADDVAHLAEWGIRKNAEVLQADVVENFKNLDYQEFLEEEWLKDGYHPLVGFDKY